MGGPRKGLDGAGCGADAAGIEDNSPGSGGQSAEMQMARACAEGAMRGASAATSISAELPPLADQM